MNKKDFIKEFANKVGILTIRTLSYGQSFELIKEMVEEAKKDFPKLEDQDIKVVQYGGIIYKNTRGIEFRVPEETKIPEEYMKVGNTEKII